MDVRKKIGLYFILFSFLYPRGFSEYFSIYKQVMTLCLYVALLIIIVYFVFWFASGQLKLKRVVWSILLYFGMMLIETLFLQGGIKEGLQKVFATPILLLFLLIVLSNEGKEVINIMGNVLLFDNILNCSLFCPFMLKQIMGSDYITNINFIGHVQICAQIGVLGMAISYLIYNLGHKIKAKVLIVLSLITMLISGAVASYFSVTIIIIAYLLYKTNINNILVKLSPKWIFLFGTFLQIIIIPFVIWYKIDFGARYYVWNDAIMRLNNHYISGFGVHGVLIHTFWMEWTGDIGMNYAHNEILQMLLDGGVILLCSYLIMCLCLIRNYNISINKRTRYWFNCFLFIFMMIGICESVTEYNYFYMFIMLLFFLSKHGINFQKRMDMVL